MIKQKEILIKVSREKFSKRYTKNKDNGCWEWVGSLVNGYGRYNNLKAHRLAWFIYNGEDPGDKYVLHLCDNRKCVNPQHLFLGNQSDNMKDMWEKGRRKHNKKLRKHSQKTIDEIRKAHKTGEYTYQEIGNIYGMNRSMVYKIVKNKIWKP